MRVKTKLTLGVGLLFLLILLLSVVSVFYINALKIDTEDILKDNYNSVQYARNILFRLSDSSEEAIQQFRLDLEKQEKNITEIGEKEATEALRKNLVAYSQNRSDSKIKSQVEQNVFQIMDANMQAIQRKSEVAKITADKAVFWIAVSGTLCFLIAFTLLINLPASIADPIAALTQSIKQIAAKNYAQRVHFESHNEFGELTLAFNTMAEKLEEYNSSNLARLMTEKKRIEALINNMHDPVIGLDENLKVIFVNEEAVKITGIRAENLVGKSAQELAVQNDLMRMLIQNLELSGNQTPTVPIKIFADNKEGYFEKQTILISIIPTGELVKKPIGHVFILRNITSYKELDFAKTNFIATVSHELKTPISSIKMSLQLLDNERIGNLNEEQKHLLDSISEDAGRLLKITGELLNMTQVESGNIQLSMLPVSPEEILQYAILATRTQAEQKQIQFAVDCPEDIANVQADSEKTAWVLTNLISNAIHYSYENATIYLSIRQQNGKVFLAVRDTGQGIAPQYQGKVFDRYFRVPGTKKEGTGLGLSISREFIEAQGGEISVESEFGAGSTFRITLKAVA